jgi:RNA polymerase sigma-32 factor
MLHQLSQNDYDFLKKHLKTPLLQNNKEVMLLERWCLSKDRAALDTLVRAYTRLVISMALRYQQKHLHFMDLVQEGFLGLLKAAERFDLDRKTCFASYARFWIVFFIQNYILTNWSIVSLTKSVESRNCFFHYHDSEFERIIDSFVASLEVKTLKGYELSQELKDKMDKKLKKVEKIKARLKKADVSIHQPLSPRGPRTILDLMPIDLASPEEQILSKESHDLRQKTINLALSKLQKFEQYIITRHFLMLPYESLEKIRGKLGITKSCIYALKNQALQKLKISLLENKDFFSISIE